MVKHFVEGQEIKHMTMVFRVDVFHAPFVAKNQSKTIGIVHSKISARRFSNRFPLDIHISFNSMEETAEKGHHSLL